MKLQMLPLQARTLVHGRGRSAQRHTARDNHPRIKNPVLLVLSLEAFYCSPSSGGGREKGGGAVRCVENSPGLTFLKGPLVPQSGQRDGVLEPPPRQGCPLSPFVIWVAWLTE